MVPGEGLGPPGILQMALRRAQPSGRPRALVPAADFRGDGLRPAERQRAEARPHSPGHVPFHAQGGERRHCPGERVVFRAGFPGPAGQRHELHPPVRRGLQPGGLLRAPAIPGGRETRRRSESFEDQDDYYFRFEGRSHHAGEYQNYLEYFARCLDSGQAPKPDVPEGIITVALLEALEEAVARGRTGEDHDVLARRGLGGLLARPRRRRLVTRNNVHCSSSPSA